MTGQLLPPLEFRAKLRDLKKDHSYPELEESYGVNRYYLWNIVEDPKYRPPLWICVKLGIEVHQAKVVSINGRQIPDGSQAHMAQLCECGQYFISNHPRRKRCFLCSPYRGKR